MPVAVMAEGAFSFKKLLDQCENQELEVTIRVALGGAAGGLRVPGGTGLQGNRAWGLRIGGGAGGGRLQGAGARPVESGALACFVAKDPGPVARTRWELFVVCL